MCVPLEEVDTIIRILYSAWHTTPKVPCCTWLWARNRPMFHEAYYIFTSFADACRVIWKSTGLGPAATLNIKHAKQCSCFCMFNIFRISKLEDEDLQSCAGGEVGSVNSWWCRSSTVKPKRCLVKSRLVHLKLKKGKKEKQWFQLPTPIIKTRWKKYT